MWSIKVTYNDGTFNTYYDLSGHKAKEMSIAFMRLEDLKELRVWFQEETEQ